ncbi:polymorphic toxin type 15 domain-containing protein [Clostridium felsineum]|uniref:Uncharacterized protein n=1 Tax=Clostridium felsineum TaxID=36839 RepID=A0A1S8L3B4_9CLOT|nr:polymorphic toxin type 15 domain-containing protein [Clostridium felsineum]URZ07503.1 hypothetical protein CLROS_028410 [Clostridium felsineum]URZ12534.1 hypothetical protein CROST_032560 [Clostridium felsineum]
MADKIKMEVLIMDSMISKFRAIGDRSNNIINRLRQIENGVKNSYIADSSIKIQGNIDDVLKSGREVTETLYTLSIQLNSAKDAIIRADKDSYNNIKLNTIIRGKEDFSKVKDSKDTISNMEKVIGYFGLGAMVSISDNLALGLPNLTGLYNDKRLRYNLENENRYGVLAAYQYGKTFGDIEGLAQGAVEFFGGLSIMGFGGLGAGALTVATDGAAAPVVPLVESAGIALAGHGIGMFGSSLYNMGSDFSKGNFYFSKIEKTIARIKEIKVNFNYKSKYNETEFARQLADQEAGMNKLTVDEYLKNRERYIKKGRAIEGNMAQQAARDKALVDKVDELRSTGMPLKEAETQAQKWLEKQAALHNPDQIAGGNPLNIGGMGDKAINSSIGAQWKYRIDAVDEQIQSLAKNMTDAERKSTYLNVKLKY